MRDRLIACYCYSTRTEKLLRQIVSAISAAMNTVTRCRVTVNAAAVKHRRELRMQRACAYLMTTMRDGVVSPSCSTDDCRLAH